MKTPEDRSWQAIRIVGGTATISLAFLLLAVVVAWMLREQSIAADRKRERSGRRRWKTIAMRAEETTYRRLDLAYDELLRKLHRATTQPESDYNGDE